MMLTKMQIKHRQQMSLAKKILNQRSFPDTETLIKFQKLSSPFTASPSDVKKIVCKHKNSDECLKKKRRTPIRKPKINKGRYPEAITEVKELVCMDLDNLREIPIEKLNWRCNGCDKGTTLKFGRFNPSETKEYAEKYEKVKCNCAKCRKLKTKPIEKVPSFETLFSPRQTKKKSKKKLKENKWENLIVNSVEYMKHHKNRAKSLQSLPREKKYLTKKFATNPIETDIYEGNVKLKALRNTPSCFERLRLVPIKDIQTEEARVKSRVKQQFYKNQLLDSFYDLLPPAQQMAKISTVRLTSNSDIEKLFCKRDKKRRYR